MPVVKTAAVALTLLIAAGPARAETAAEALMAAPLKATPRGIAVDLAAPGALAPRYAHAPEPRMPGVARTSVDRRFSDAGMIGSLGFLCGLEPGAERMGGPASARGHDATGRFLGAKLRVAFR